MHEGPTTEMLENRTTKPVEDGPSTAEVRLHALAAAIREHEAAQRRLRYFLRHPDIHLYRRLRQICGGAP
jgi:hypothetical protein